MRREKVKAVKRAKPVRAWCAINDGTSPGCCEGLFPEGGVELHERGMRYRMKEEGFHESWIPCPVIIADARHYRVVRKPARTKRKGK